MSDTEGEASIIDDELLRAFHSGEACPECGDTGRVFSEDTQGEEDCPSCERLMVLLPDTVATNYLVLNVPISVRMRADELLRQADGDKQTALELALECEDQVADSGYSFAVVVRELCQSRAQADYEGDHVLVEVIDTTQI